MVWIRMSPIGLYVLNNGYKLVELLEKDKECDPYWRKYVIKVGFEI